MSAIPKYQKYLRYDCWVKHVRQACLERANYVCQVCRNARATEAHHNSYDNVGAERPEDLTAVCWHCHRRLHGLPVAANDNQQIELPLLPLFVKRRS